MCQDHDVRLIVGEDYEYYYGGPNLESSYYIDRELSIGRLELCLGGQWGVACEDYWNNTQASVVCSQLGFASVGKHTYNSMMMIVQMISNFSMQYTSRCHCWKSKFSTH